MKLDQFLKFQGLTLTGGQAKYLIQSGLVSVNGEIETRRGRQLKPGDIVTVEDESLEVQLEPTLSQESPANDRDAS
ncbi:RNA-binding S4 domain-containing protein [Acaryochloris sp. IP29b_bin.148]|uniref:RNA-binding S4 domain-containing protein n=1 Tax=Acaryochloris sp. IP29b_bin.148 TaxID=2969218 RepID=UPI0026340E86|nr:RNA-binding S4 domain-containing protein [Acaryochloris sp. IP29b_bin.148]